MFEMSADQKEQHSPPSDVHGNRLLIQLIMQILLSSQSFLKKSGSIRSLVADEIATMTQNKIRLIVSSVQDSGSMPISTVPLDSIAVPLQWDGISYGTLYFRQLSCPLTMAEAEKFAHICAWLIRVLEDAAYVRQRRPLVSKEYMQRLNSLTRREFEVLQLMANGYSTDEISEKLFLSKRTVEKHQMHIYNHLHVSSSQDAVLIGLLGGLDLGGF